MLLKLNNNYQNSKKWSVKNKLLVTAQFQPIAVCVEGSFFLSQILTSVGASHWHLLPSFWWPTDLNYSFITEVTRLHQVNRIDVHPVSALTKETLSGWGNLATRLICQGLHFMYCPGSMLFVFGSTGQRQGWIIMLGWDASPLLMCVSGCKFVLQMRASDKHMNQIWLNRYEWMVVWTIYITL